MRFVRLRIAGFKSFVNPVEAPIDEGVTGIVGPNGCGKSNFLEALRWVMGATSAKAMRAGGMEDVIFSGTTERPARNHAEVTLVIDNSDGLAPSRLGRDTVIEVSRRITRGQGSTYRINGRETRARDVQLLFADASSGANSPALVRQGQINELIAAKPENRRRVLEEAAGVAGLRARRHEAELKLRSAESNLERLDDIAGEQERRLEALRRQSREAQRYRKLSLEIKALETRQHVLRWREANEAAQAAKQQLTAAETRVVEAERAGAAAAAAATEIAGELTPAREETAIASAVAGRLARQREELDRKLAAARAEANDLKKRIEDLDADAARERGRLADADEELTRLAESGAGARDEDAEKLALAKVAAAERAAAKAETARAEAERTLDELTAARGHALAERAAAEATKMAAERSLATARSALETAKSNAPETNSEEAATRAEAARTAAENADAELAKARTALEKAEADIEKADAAWSHAKDDARRADAALARLSAERDALEAVNASEQSEEYAPVSDQLEVDAGFERAVAAALGADLDASLDVEAPHHWTGAADVEQTLPDGAAPLVAHVRAPTELHARLTQIGVVESDEVGARLAADLKPGQRLVARSGAMWRWDGLTARADAPSPAAARLERRTRLDALSNEIEAAQDDVAKTAKAAAAKEKALNAGKAALHEARNAGEAAQRNARERAREADAAETALARLHDILLAHAAKCDDAERTRSEAARALEEAVQAFGALADPEHGEADILAARQKADAARADAAEARAGVESARRAIADAAAKRAEHQRDVARWGERKSEAEARIAELVKASAAADKRLEEVAQAPDEIGAQLADAAREFETAETRRKTADDAAAELETKAMAADKAQREAERAAGEAREARAASTARAQAASERLEEIEAAAQDALGADPRSLPDDPEFAKLDAATVEKKLNAARSGRDRLGAVNLAADEESETLDRELEKLRAEREDLLAAIAKLRSGVNKLNEEGRARLREAFEVIDGHFRNLFQTLFEGGEAHLALVDSEDPLEAGLEINVSPPGKKLGSLSLMSGGEQALTATALIFAVFLSNPAPLCALDEVDAPLDDANVDRFCRMLAEMRRLTDTRFVVITHNPVTMSRMDRLYGVTMAERGVSQIVSVDLQEAERMIAAE